jgi:hypothetical protein
MGRSTGAAARIASVSTGKSDINRWFREFRIKVLGQVFGDDRRK